MTQKHQMVRVALITAVAVMIGSAGSIDAQGPPPSRPGAQPPVERRRGDNPRIPSHAPQALMVSSGDYRIDALLSSYKWSASTVTYSFYDDDVFGGTYYGSEAVSEVSEAVKTNVRAIMAWYGTLLSINFVEVTETATNIGLIRVMRSTAPSYAYAYYPAGSAMFGLSGDVHLNSSYDRLGDTNGFQQPAGEHGYVALIHEIGHALGLKHPHDDTPKLPTGEDTHTFTVMSYQFSGESPGTPMAYDLLALQYLYGARSHRTANDTYVFQRSNIDQYSLGAALYLSPSLATKQTIWDSAGYNVLDLSGVASSSGYRLDLNPLGWLTTVDNYRTSYMVAGTVLGPGVAIGKIVNSAGNDTIFANAQANVFAGYSSSRVSGHDVIHGTDGTDTIDLSGYLPGDVIESMSGSDLVLGFGSNGTVTVKNYYGINPPPSIVYATDVPRVSIADVTLTEGNSGTKSASFVVTLSPAAPGDRVVSYATEDATAHAGSDYVAASGSITFAAGETLKTVTIVINGDTTQESDETFSVRLAVADGVEILDGEGIATIVNDELPPTLPAAPSDLRAVVQYSGTGKNKVLQGVMLTWLDVSTNEEQFDVQRCQLIGRGKTQTCTYPATSTIVPSDSTSYVDPASTLTRGSTYRYRVRSLNVNGGSAWVEIQVAVP